MTVEMAVERDETGSDSGKGVQVGVPVMSPTGLGGAIVLVDRGNNKQLHPDLKIEPSSELPLGGYVRGGYFDEIPMLILDAGNFGEPGKP